MEKQFISFQEAKEAFEKSLPEINLKLEAFITKKIQTLVRNLPNLNALQLTEIETQLASSLRKLGILQAEAETKASFIEDQLKAKWKELIEERRKEDPKMSLNMIEAEFNHMFLNERINITFWKGLAKSYANQIQALNSILLGITHRLKEISQPKPVVGQQLSPEAKKPEVKGEEEISFI